MPNNRKNNGRSFNYVKDAAAAADRIAAAAAAVAADPDAATAVAAAADAAAAAAVAVADAMAAGDIAAAAAAAADAAAAAESAERIAASVAAADAAEDATVAEDAIAADDAEDPALLELDALLASMAAPLPPLPTVEKGSRTVKPGQPVWEPDAITRAAMERAGWGISEKINTGYSPRDIDALTRPIITSISANEKRGKLQKHALLNWVTAQTNLTSKGGSARVVSLAAYMIQHKDTFKGVARFNTLEGTLNALADYCGRVVLRRGDVITFSNKQEENRKR